MITSQMHQTQQTELTAFCCFGGNSCKRRRRQKGFEEWMEGRGIWCREYWGSSLLWRWDSSLQAVQRAFRPSKISVWGALKMPETPTARSFPPFLAFRVASPDNITCQKYVHQCTLGEEVVAMWGEYPQEMCRLGVVCSRPEAGEFL